MDEAALILPVNRKGRREAGLSYKFQRLRERIRQAIENGELSGKLPGERTLARRFHANAKTLGKALTDLAAEGLLDRSIGRGTYVQGAAPRPNLQRPWLILCDPEAEKSEIARLILQANPAAQVSGNLSTLRPSFINSFSAVIDLSQSTPDAIHRDLVIRSIPLIAAGREPRTYSTHCIMIDRAMGAAHLGRELVLSGHRRMAAIDHRGDAEVHDALLKTAARCAPDASVDRGFVEDVPALLQNGVTALVCDSALAARRVQKCLDEFKMTIPRRIALAAVGTIDHEAPCTGYFVTAREEAETILQTLRDMHQRRPVTLWLVGKYIDRGTCAGPEFQTTTASMTLSSEVRYRERTPLPLSSGACPSR